MKVLIAVLGLLGTIALNELSEISPWLGRRLAKWAAGLRYGRCDRADTRAEEWQALIDQHPGKLFKLAAGLGYFATALLLGAMRLLRRAPANLPPSLTIAAVPHHRLTYRQRTTLLTLMAVGNEGLSSRDLMETYRIQLLGNDRRALNELGLVSSRRVGRIYVHELTDRGWAWCTHEMRAFQAGRPGASDGALTATVAGISRFMDQNGLTLADIFAESRSGTNHRGARGRGASDEIRRPETREQSAIADRDGGQT